MKKCVETEIKFDNGTKTEYVGRFLGFIHEEDYKKVIGNPAITSRIESKPTKNLIGCCNKANEKNWGLGGIRFVIAVRKRNSLVVTDKILLVSERLNFIAELRPDMKEVVFVTVNGNQISMKEREASVE